MKFNLDSASGLMVSTPIMVGDAEAVRKAAACGHGSWKETSREMEEGHEIINEQCVDCVAKRFKFAADAFA